MHHSDSTLAVTVCGQETFTREQVGQLIATAIRWGYEARVDEENSVWPDTTLVFNTGATIRALDRKRYREACDAAPPTGGYTGGPVHWETGWPVAV